MTAMTEMTKGWGAECDHEVHMDNYCPLCYHAYLIGECERTGNPLFNLLDDENFGSFVDEFIRSHEERSEEMTMSRSDATNCILDLVSRFLLFCTDFVCKVEELRHFGDKSNILIPINDKSLIFTDEKGRVTIERSPFHCMRIIILRLMEHMKTTNLVASIAFTEKDDKDAAYIVGYLNVTILYMPPSEPNTTRFVTQTSMDNYLSIVEYLKDTKLSEPNVTINSSDKTKSWFHSNEKSFFPSNAAQRCIAAYFGQTFSWTRKGTSLVFHIGVEKKGKKVKKKAAPA